MVESTIRTLINKGQGVIRPLETLQRVSRMPRSAFEPVYLISLAVNFYGFTKSQNVGLHWLHEWRNQGHADTEESSPTTGGKSDEKRISTTLRSALGLFNSFEPSNKSNFVFIAALLQAALVPWMHHVGRPFTPDAIELPSVREPVVLTIIVALFIALVEQTRGEKVSNLAQWLQIAPLPFRDNLIITGMLVGTCAGLLCVDIVLRAMQNIMNA